MTIAMPNGIFIVYPKVSNCSVWLLVRPLFEKPHSIALTKHTFKTTII
jgi:hypothetical protein